MTTVVHELPGGKLLDTLSVTSKYYIVDGIRLKVTDASLFGFFEATTVSRFSPAGANSSLDIYPGENLSISITDPDGIGIQVRRKS